MRVSRLVAAAVAALAMSAVAAQASPGFSTADVNIRTGPDIDFPSVGVIPEGEPLSIEGCLRDESWCDVRWDGGRGWVYSEYLAFDERGEMVPLPDYGAAYFRIPFVTFVARDYWDRYYVGRPWYRDRDRWYGYRIRPRVGWYAPPPGPRRSGWWRQNYHAPPGMRAPPGRGWRRPERYEHRGERRDDRRDDRGGRRDDRRDDRGDRRDDRRDDRGDRRDDRRDDRGDRRDGRRDGR
jgi:uncharacterized protein YraI